MEIKSRNLYVKTNGMVAHYIPSTDRKLLAKVRSYPGESLRVLIKYRDDEHESKKLPQNDSGWFRNRAELEKVTQAFLQE